MFYRIGARKKKKILKKRLALTEEKLDEIRAELEASLKNLLCLWLFSVGWQTYSSHWHILAKAAVLQNYNHTQPFASRL
jgi:hypothetical protein